MDNDLQPTTTDRQRAVARQDSLAISMFKTMAHHYPSRISRGARPIMALMASTSGIGMATFLQAEQMKPSNRS